MDKNALLATAKSVLEKNWTGTFTKPAPNLYPHQWNWDAGFIAIGCAHFEIGRAEIELRHLFQGQWENGMLPHIIFGKEKGASYFPGPDFWQCWNNPHSPKKPATSGITQPPVFGFVLWRIYEIAEDKERAKWLLRELFPKVIALHRYLYENRDPLEEGLCYIQHPWESGTDNSPSWDKVLERIEIDKIEIPLYERQDLQNPTAARHRPTDADYDRYVHLVDIFRKNNYDDAAIFEQSPFLVQDPLFNAILSWSNECLIKIGEILEENVSEIIGWNELTTYSMNEKLWDEEFGIYNAWDLKANELIPLETSSGLIPLVAGIPTQDQAEKMFQLLKSQAFSGSSEAPAYLCPSYSLLTDDIDYQKYWRGPVWINMNWMLYLGLKRYGFGKAAKQLKTESLELLSKNGFFEYFDPRKSVGKDAGYGANQFSWSAALCIDFLKG